MADKTPELTTHQLAEALSAGPDVPVAAVVTQRYNPRRHHSRTYAVETIEYGDIVMRHGEIKQVLFIIVETARRLT